MKRKIQILTAAAAVAVAVSAMPLSAAAEDSVVYGTMNIPYTDFYAAELGEGAGEVDAVTSATKNKALKNGEGELFEGSYNNGEDTILGVTYPVAISQADLDALGDNNYGFAKLDAAPEAYKTVTVADGKATFSAVQDASPEKVTAAVKLSTETPWGDYLIDLADQPEGFDTKYRGAILRTADGMGYAMRHEQNIWRGEIAWSSGIKTEEPHGNKLDYAAYTGLMGSTVKEIVLITKAGYVTVETDTYIPVKFAGSIAAADSAAGTGKTAITEDGIPADYDKKYTAGEGFTVENGEISYTDAMPGSYSLKLSDGSGKYADLSASYTLTTDKLPVKYADGKIVKADDATDAEAANFMKNLASVTVGETKLNASGRGAVKVITDDGAIDFAAESRTGKVFADGENGNYQIAVAATGYTKTLDITISAQAAETTAAAVTTAPAAAVTTTTTKAAAAVTTTAKSSSSSSSSKSTSSPKTGDAGVGAAAALLAAASAALVLGRKKRGE